MRYGWMILIMLCLTIGLPGCQAANSSTPAPQEPAIQTDSPGSLPQSNSTLALTPTLPQEDIDMTPATPPNESAEQLVARVKEHLAKKLGIPIDQIVLSDIKPVVWRDAGLGCPKPGVDYIQVETPGYNILLAASGETYRYHTDQIKRFVQCNK
jgi:hypothetical protein